MLLLCRLSIIWMLLMCCVESGIFFFKQKTAYEMRISDWSSDVCSSDLVSPRSGRIQRSAHSLAAVLGWPRVMIEAAFEILAKQDVIEIERRNIDRSEERRVGIEDVMTGRSTW